MRDHIHRIAAALSGAVSALSAQQGEAPTVVVRSLLPFSTPSVHSDVAMTSALFDEHHQENLALGSSGRTGAPGWLLPLLQQRHRAAIDSGQLQLSLSSEPVLEDGEPKGDRVGDQLILSGRRSDVEPCRRDLDAIAALVGRPIEVTAFQLPLPDGALPSPTWTAAQLQQTLQQTKPLWTARGSTRSGGALRLANERGRSHLHDVDVEVAEKAQIADPKIGVAFAGVRATLVAHALPGDELVLSGSWLLSDPVVMHNQPLGKAPGDGSLDLPEHRTALVTFAGRVSTGGALVVAGRGGGVGPDGFLLVIAARYLAPPPGDAAPDLLVRPVSALLPWSMLARPNLEWRRPNDDRELFPVVPYRDGITRTDLQRLMTLRPSTEVTVSDQVLILSGEADACRIADALLQQLAAGVQNAAWHVRATADGKPPLELVQPILNGRSAAAFVGRERAIVRDFEVEIAAKAAIANPVVGVVRSGLWFGATTIAGTAGAGQHVTGSWSLAAFDPPSVRVHEAATPLHIQVVDYRLTTLPWDSVMTTGQDHALGNGPAWESGGPATAVSVKLLAR
jgi:hypothetical protein